MCARHPSTLPRSVRGRQSSYFKSAFCTANNSKKLTSCCTSRAHTHTHAKSEQHRKSISQGTSSHTVTRNQARKKGTPPCRTFCCEFCLERNLLDSKMNRFPYTHCVLCTVFSSAVCAPTYKILRRERYKGNNDAMPYT